MMSEKIEQLSPGDLLVSAPGRLIRAREILVELWHYRELLYFLIWKDVKVKYKQTTLGVAWAILQPLLGMAMFTLLFGKLAKLPSDGLPYPVFYYAALLTWTYFATTVTMASNSIVTSGSLISKVYFPRILLPSAAVIGGILDLAIASVILTGLIVFYNMPLTLGLIMLPLILIPLVTFTLGVGFFLAALTVNFRDVRYALPFIVQVWMFASPVVYPSSMVPEQFRPLVSINPIAGIIETTRALIAGRPVPWGPIGISSIVTVFVLVLGIRYFRRTERRFADMI